MQLSTVLERFWKSGLVSTLLVFVATTFACVGIADAAGIVVYEEGDKYLKIGGRLLVQYHLTDPDTGDAEDEVLFRSLCPSFEGSFYNDWIGKFQWDMGKASGDNEVDIKDAYLQYNGFQGLKISVGNASLPFSREWLTSVQRQELVERTFAGDHNFGTPSRQLGIHLTGEAAGKKFTYSASLASACIDPDVKKIDFDTPANNADDWNQGWIAGGRLEYHPMGQFKFSQGDFSGKPLTAVAVAAFTWSNDDDNNTYTDAATGLSMETGKVDIDAVTGLEISAAFRGAGFSIDAEYNLFDAKTVDGTFTGGLFENGETRLTTWVVESGYMLVPARLELAAGYQSMDADNYDDEWTRTSIGLNCYLHEHDIKLQTTYQMGKSLNGKEENDADELYIQAQYVF
jgi:hypothetical protein